MIESRLHALLADEHGNVIVIVAAGLTAFVLLVALVVDVANWKVHSRHLQLQADAAALAAAHSFTSGGCSDGLIQADAHEYGGADASGALALYNDQVGGTQASKMHILVNSDKYYGDPGWGDNTDPNGSPCTAKYVDIKATETDLPWYFGFGGLVPKINAHARVGLLQESSANGTLPIAVPNPLPRSAAALFINEGTKAVVRTAPLTDLGLSNGLDVWQSTSSPPFTQVPIQSIGTGLVIALSGRGSVDISSNDLTTICQQNLTDCYDAGSDPPTIGLSYIQGYSTSGSGTPPAAPIVRSVALFGTTCSAYFSNGTCTYDVVARIDAGAGFPKADQIYGANGVTMTSSTDPNCANVAGADQCWHANLTVPANTGAQTVDITWEITSGLRTVKGKVENCSSNNGNKCTGNFGVVQRAYSAADATSGPIKAVEIRTCDGDPSCSSPAVQSYPTGSSPGPAFVVAIGLAGILKNATDQSDPLVALRVALQGGGGNTGHSLDCDPGYQNLKQELAYGCRPTYIPNPGTPDCSTIGSSAIWPPAPELQQPWPCIAVNNGSATNDVSAGLNLRVLLDDKASTCPAAGENGHNNWSMFDQNYVPTGPSDPRGQDGFPVGDRRILNAYLTTYGAFSHVNGNSGSVPVLGFGHFYVTGWTGKGNGFDNPCEKPGGGDNPVPNDDKGLIVGHFIRYIDSVGGDGTAPCDPNSINACVIVMTK